MKKFIALIILLLVIVGVFFALSWFGYLPIDFNGFKYSFRLSQNIQGIKNKSQFSIPYGLEENEVYMDGFYGGQFINRLYYIAGKELHSISFNSTTNVICLFSQKIPDYKIPPKSNFFIQISSEVYGEAKWIKPSSIYKHATYGTALEVRYKNNSRNQVREIIFYSCLD